VKLTRRQLKKIILENLSEQFKTPKDRGQAYSDNPNQYAVDKGMWPFTPRGKKPWDKRKGAGMPPRKGKESVDKQGAPKNDCEDLEETDKVYNWEIVEAINPRTDNMASPKDWVKMGKGAGKAFIDMPDIEGESEEEYDERYEDYIDAMIESGFAEGTLRDVLGHGTVINPSYSGERWWMQVAFEPNFWSGGNLKGYIVLLRDPKSKSSSRTGNMFVKGNEAIIMLPWSESKAFSEIANAEKWCTLDTGTFRKAISSGKIIMGNTPQTGAEAKLSGKKGVFKQPLWKLWWKNYEDDQKHHSMEFQKDYIPSMSDDDSDD